MRHTGCFSLLMCSSILTLTRVLDSSCRWTSGRVTDREPAHERFDFHIGVDDIESPPEMSVPNLRPVLTSAVLLSIDADGTSFPVLPLLRGIQQLVRAVSNCPTPSTCQFKLDHFRDARALKAWLYIILCE